MDAIMIKLKNGAGLTDKEKSFLRTALKDPNEGTITDALEIMYLYPLECSVEYRDFDLLRDVQRRVKNGFGKAYALSLLCNWLGCGEAFRHELMEVLLFLGEHEGDEYLRIKACTLLGATLGKTPNPETSRVLSEVMNDEARSIEVREASRDALLRASGMTSSEIMKAELEGAGAELWHRALSLSSQEHVVRARLQP